MENSIDIHQLQAYVDANTALREAVGATAGETLVLSPFAQGEYNANYRFQVGAGEHTQDYLLRVNLGSQMHLENQITYEYESLRLLEPSGRVPRTYYMDATQRAFPFGILVEELLPGRSLRYGEDLDAAAAILADIHAVEVPATCHLVCPAHPIAAIVEECEAMFGVYRAWSQADEALIARINALFTQAHAIAQRDRETPPPARPCVVNTEVNSSNFLINPGGQSYLIDWEKPVLGEAAQDLAHFLVPTTTYWKTDTLFTRANVDDFVARYCVTVAGRFATEGLRERLEDYLVVTCLRGLTWCAMAYTEYEGGHRAAFNAGTYAKIKEYLEDDFLTFIWDEYYAQSHEGACG